MANATLDCQKRTVWTDFMLVTVFPIQIQIQIHLINNQLWDIKTVNVIIHSKTREHVMFSLLLR